MPSDNKAKFDAKWKRIRDAVALKEPDMVPITPSPAIYPYLHAGYTMTEVIYDETMEKGAGAMIKYLQDFDPDNGTPLGNYVAEGKLMELQAPTNMTWSGMPGNPIGDNSIQQYIEFPILLDDEFDEFFNDYVTWRVHKELPRNSKLLKPLENFRLGRGTLGLASAVSKPEMREMIKTLWEIDDGYKVLNAKKAAFNKQVEDMGYPMIRAAMPAGVPFDGYSDFLRGTLLSLADLYTNPEEVRRYIDATFEQTISAIKASKGREDGKLVFMALHKGMDGFMSDEHYREYYWSHLQKIIETIIEVGKVPYIFTEGKYNSRLDCLTEVPVGKVFYHFEEVDMALAKSKLGKIACIGGGFSPYLLNNGTREQVVDECKRLLDICAPGGGFVFETAYGMDYAKDENVEAMFDTVRTYGKY